MAGRAGVKLHVPRLPWTARPIPVVAFFASYLQVQAGQRIWRLGVVKFLRSFPAFHVVALDAFVFELALMRICMARRARSRQSEIGF